MNDNKGKRYFRIEGLEFGWIWLIVSGYGECHFIPSKAKLSFFFLQLRVERETETGILQNH
ncbi:hypothetical protein CUMW_044940 [Citrus unshiu]|nr:hypothetical protein CUMW_044940 [Citrus unshiu]